MKLELKHLAPYLPYSLKYLYNDEILELDGLDVNQDAFNCDIGETPFENIKPILKPLSDLTKEDLIEDLGTETSCLDWTTSEREHWIKFYSREHWINNLPYLIYSHLVKNHFDVFGLIEAGLAIDINTL